MRVLIHGFLLGSLAAVALPAVHAKDMTSNSPQAGARSYAQNYKDMVLAECLATAYRRDSDTVKDAGSSASALRDWTNYDWEKHPYDGVRRLVERYLARDYANPLAESEVRGVRFDLLKCLDLYHSKELEIEARRIVIKPARSYRQDNPSSVEQK